MASASVQTRFDESTLEQFNQQLKALERIGKGQLGVIVKGLEASGKPIVQRVKESLPKPGYPGDKPGLKPLRDTIRTDVKGYGTGVLVAVTGYAYPAGAHGHLAEAGHRIAVGGQLRPIEKPKKPRKLKKDGTPYKERAKRVDPAQMAARFTGRHAGDVTGRWDIRNAAEATRSAQGDAVVIAVRRAIEEALRV